MGNHLMINNPQNKVKTTLPVLEETVQENTFTPVKETEKNIVLYTDKQVFFHTPRFKSEIEGKTVTIEPPPKEQKKDDMPAIDSNQYALEENFYDNWNNCCVQYLKRKSNSIKFYYRDYLMCHYDYRYDGITYSSNEI